MTTYNVISGEDFEGDTIEVEYSTDDPTVPVLYRYPDVSDKWQPCQYQSNDVRGRSESYIIDLVARWAN